MDEEITGNPDILKAEDLHSPAWEIMQPYFEQTQQAAFNYYQELAGTGQSSNNIQEIVPTAYYRMVDTLFVAVGVQQWGNFTPEENQVTLHGNQETGDEDLLDFAAIHTLLNGGTVYAVEPELLPDNTQLAAVFRF